MSVTADDYFSLFGLPARFDLDTQSLESAWRVVAAQVHPDRFATASPAERRVAMQWAARANEAYRQLREPLSRARYLCEQAGVDLQTEHNTAMDPAFLLQQMEWRERLDEARGDRHAWEGLQTELAAARAQLCVRLTQLIDENHDYEAAGKTVREGMFVEKLIQALADARPDE